MNDFEQEIFLVLKEAVRQVYGVDPEDAVLMVEIPRDHQLGDYATGAAMKLARTLHKNPMDIAQPLLEKLRELLPETQSVTAVKPGFINLSCAAAHCRTSLTRCRTPGARYGENSSGQHQRVLVEWVSSNPAGDLHCGHARNSALDDTICRLLATSGYDVLREFYVNDFLSAALPAMPVVSFSA